MAADHAYQEPTDFRTLSNRPADNAKVVPAGEVLSGGPSGGPSGDGGEDFLGLNEAIGDQPMRAPVEESLIAPYIPPAPAAVEEDVVPGVNPINRPAENARVTSFSGKSDLNWSQNARATDFLGLEMEGFDTEASEPASSDPDVLEVFLDENPETRADGENWLLSLDHAGRSNDPREVEPPGLLEASYYEPEPVTRAFSRLMFRLIAVAAILVGAGAAWHLLRMKEHLGLESSDPVRIEGLPTQGVQLESPTIQTTPQATTPNRTNVRRDGSTRSTPPRKRSRFSEPGELNRSQSRSESGGERSLFARIFGPSRVFAGEPTRDEKTGDLQLRGIDLSPEEMAAATRSLRSPFVGGIAPHIPFLCFDAPPGEEGVAQMESSPTRRLTGDHLDDWFEEPATVEESTIEPSRLAFDSLDGWIDEPAAEPSAPLAVDPLADDPVAQVDSTLDPGGLVYEWSAEPDDEEIVELADVTDEPVSSVETLDDWFDEPAAEAPVALVMSEPSAEQALEVAEVTDVSTSTLQSMDDWFDEPAAEAPVASVMSESSADEAVEVAELSDEPVSSVETLDDWFDEPVAEAPVVSVMSEPSAEQALEVAEVTDVSVSTVETMDDWFDEPMAEAPVVSETTEVVDVTDEPIPSMETMDDWFDDDPIAEAPVAAMTNDVPVDEIQGPVAQVSPNIDAGGLSFETLDDWMDQPELRSSESPVVAQRGAEQPTVEVTVVEEEPLEFEPVDDWFDEPATDPALTLAEVEPTVAEDPLEFEPVDDWFDEPATDPALTVAEVEPTAAEDPLDFEPVDDWFDEPAMDPALTVAEVEPTVAEEPLEFEPVDDWFDEPATDPALTVAEVEPTVAEEPFEFEPVDDWFDEPATDPALTVAEVEPTVAEEPLEFEPVDDWFGEPATDPALTVAEVKPTVAEDPFDFEPVDDWFDEPATDPALTVAEVEPTVAEDPLEFEPTGDWFDEPATDPALTVAEVEPTVAEDPLEFEPVDDWFVEPATDPTLTVAEVEPTVAEDPLEFEPAGDWFDEPATDPTLTVAEVEPTVAEDPLDFEPVDDWFVEPATDPTLTVAEVEPMEPTVAEDPLEFEPAGDWFDEPATDPALTVAEVEPTVAEDPLELEPAGEWFGEPATDPDQTLAEVEPTVEPGPLAFESLDGWLDEPETESVGTQGEPVTTVVAQEIPEPTPQVGEEDPDPSTGALEAWDDLFAQANEPVENEEPAGMEDDPAAEALAEPETLDWGAFDDPDPASEIDPVVGADTGETVANVTAPVTDDVPLVDLGPDPREVEPGAGESVNGTDSTPDSNAITLVDPLDSMDPADAGAAGDGEEEPLTEDQRIAQRAVADAEDNGEVLKRQKIRDHWYSKRVPAHMIDALNRVRTPRVGKVRVVYKNGEVFEGRLFGVGKGSLWVETSLGRMTLDGSRVVKIDRIEEAVASAESEEAEESDLPLVQVRTRGGVFVGRQVARIGSKVTLITEEGMRITLKSDDVRPITGKPKLINIKRPGEQ